MVRNGSNGRKRRTRAKAQAESSSYQQALGQKRSARLEPAHVVGVTGWDGDLAAAVAQGIGACWARAGERIMLLRHQSVPHGFRRRSAPVVSPGGPQRVCAVEGPGCLHTLTVPVRTSDDFALPLAQARACYDRVLVTESMANRLPDVAEVYVEVVNDQPVDACNTQWGIEDGLRVLQSAPSDDGQRAWDWRNRALRSTDFGRPLIGLVVIESHPAAHAATAAEGWAWVTDEQLALAQLTVLGRLPTLDRDPQSFRQIAPLSGGAAWEAAALTVRAGLPLVARATGDTACETGALTSDSRGKEQPLSRAGAIPLSTG